MKPRRAWLASAALAAAALAGCRWLPRAAQVPMPVSRHPLSREAQAPLLVVMLPGVYSFAHDFVDEGFVPALRARGFAADVWLADMHFGYLENGTLLERLRDDVLLPAQRAGYRRIWLVGISLGGFAALGLLRQQPHAIDGVLAIAPYVGRPALLQQVAAAGGAAAYALVAPPGDVEGGLWKWLGGAQAPRDRIHLYTGSDDRFIEGHRLMQALLPKDHVVVLPGAHDWTAWSALWSHWLARAPWPQVAPGRTGAASRAKRATAGST